MPRVVALISNSLLVVLISQRVLVRSSQTPYDFIVVGGGAAGCFASKVLAERGSTLLLERGKPLSEYSNVLKRTQWPKVLGTDAVKWYMTNRGYEAQGNTMGGGSAVNYGILAHPGDEWFRDAGLSDNAALKRAWDAVMSLGWDAPLEADSLEEAFSKAFDKYVKPSTKHLTRTLFSEDGSRKTAASILEPKPQKLTIETGALVDKLKLEGTQVVGVSYQQGGSAKEALLKGGSSRVFLAAGPFETPALLMRSGLGKQTELDSLGIPFVAEDAKLGSFVDRSTMFASVDFSVAARTNRTRVGEDAALLVLSADVRTLGDNFYETAGGGLVAWFGPYTQEFYNATKRSDTCASGMTIGLSSLGGDAGVNNQAAFSTQAIPKGSNLKGGVALTSKDAQTSPLVNLKFDDSAWPTLEKGLDIVLDIMEDSIFDNFAAPFSSEQAQCMAKYDLISLTKLMGCAEPDMLLECKNDASKFVSHRNTIPVPDKAKAPDLHSTTKDYTFPVWHATGGSSSAIDANYKVKALNGVYVVDSSAAAVIPPVNPQAAIMTVAHYVADVISAPQNSGTLETSGTTMSATTLPWPVALGVAIVFAIRD